MSTTPTPQPMDFSDFASQIRAKYPGAYDHIPDQELAQKVVDKYPQYKSQVNLPPPMPSAPAVVPEAGMLDKASTAAVNAGDWMKNAWNQFQQGNQQSMERLKRNPMQEGLAEAKPFVRSAELAGAPAMAGEQLVKSIPTVSKLQPLFQETEAATKAAGTQIPMGGQTLQEIAGRMQQLKDMGHTASPQINKFIKRVGGSDLTFEQARDLYSAMSSKLAKQTLRGPLSGQMSHQLDTAVDALGELNQQGAKSAGAGEAFSKAMKQYPTAKTVQAITPTWQGTKAAVVKALPDVPSRIASGALLGLGGTGVYRVLKSLGLLGEK